MLFPASIESLRMDVDWKHGNAFNQKVRELNF